MNPGKYVPGKKWMIIIFTILLISVISIFPVFIPFSSSNVTSEGSSIAIKLLQQEGYQVSSIYSSYQSLEKYPYGSLLVMISPKERISLFEENLLEKFPLQPFL